MTYRSRTTTQSRWRRIDRLPRPSRPSALGWAAVLVAPLLGVALLRAPFVNALTDNDTWFYSGYGWALAHHVEIFGWFYYADRFTVVLPIAVSTGLFGPDGGYLVLRYLAVVMAGGCSTLCPALHVCLRSPRLGCAS